MSITLSEEIDQKTFAAETRSNNLAPKLRFKGFYGGWKKTQLGNITEKVNSGKTPLGGNSVYVTEGILFIRSQNVLGDKLSFENSTFITNEINNTMKNSIVKSNDILLNITGASLGRSCVVPENFSIGNVNQHVCIIRLTKENNPYFLQPIFSSEKGQNLFTSLQTGSGREGLNFQSIKKIVLKIPTLPEQQKIASFLSAVDEKIQQLTRKKELLEQYKKGVMQNLFSGKLRFKPALSEVEGDENGKDFPDWEEKRLGDVCDSISSGKSKSSENGVFSLYGSTGIIGNCHAYSHDGVFILIARVGANAGTINLVNGKFGVSDNTLVMICNKQTNIEYIYFYLAFYNLNKLIFGSGQPLITGGQLKNLDLNLPTLSEQQKISTYLSSIDTKIESVSNQITQTQTFKKGLLQQMFV